MGVEQPGVSRFARICGVICVYRIPGKEELAVSYPVLKNFRWWWLLCVPALPALLWFWPVLWCLDWLSEKDAPAVVRMGAALTVCVSYAILTVFVLSVL